MIIIFVEQVSERLIYSLEFIFKERDIIYEITNDASLFEKSSFYKLNYSNLNFENVIQIRPSSLLWDEDIKLYEVTLAKFKNEPCLAFDGCLDPLSSIFYVLARVEEYLSQYEDIHGRFLAKYSIQYKFQLIDRVVCDRWAMKIIESICEFYKVNIKIEKPQTIIVPTFDIDNTFAYQWKKGVRKWLSVIRDYIKRDRFRIQQRKNVLAGNEKDPYDTFDQILSISNRFKVYVFWLIGDYARYDKNISHLDTRHRKLINNICKKIKLGLHPSYKSNSFYNSIKTEKSRLEEIIDDDIVYSRQHFLRLKISSTYSSLIKAGFRHDFSMGFSDHVGFRCGTARPHFWFDLKKNRISNLMVHPFAYMDGTLNEYMGLSIDDSKKQIFELYKEVENFGGEFLFIWHNETIGNYGKWNGWNGVLKYTLSLGNNE